MVFKMSKNRVSDGLSTTGVLSLECIRRWMSMNDEMAKDIIMQYRVKHFKEKGKNGLLCIQV